MRTRRGTRVAIGLLAGVAGLLAALDFHLLQSSVDIAPVPPAARKDEARLPGVPEPVTSLDKKTAEQFRETVDRPLFSPSRTPVQRKQTVAAEEPGARSKLRLIGVMRLGDEAPRALMRFGDEPTGKWITEGAEFRGWRLRKVKARSVIVESGPRSQELTLPANVPTKGADPKPEGEAAAGGVGRD
jgi:hypothetical protein